MLALATSQVVQRNGMQVWKETYSLGLEGHLEFRCHTNVKGMTSNGIKLFNEEDYLAWSWNVARGNVTTKLGYDLVVLSVENVGHKW